MTDMISDLSANMLVIGDGAQMPTPWLFIPLILMMVVMLTMSSASQRKKQKQHDTMMKTLKSGDKVTTSSGIIGVVVNVKDKTLSIRSADAKLEILKSAVAEITERSGEVAQSQS